MFRMFSILLLSVLSVGVAQPFADEVAALGAETWEAREAAEAQLRTVASNQVAQVLDACHAAYLENEDPELRFRARKVIEALVGQHMFRKEKGFLGVSLLQNMTDEKVNGRDVNTVNIVRVLPNHQASRHGIVAGTRIVHVDQQWCHKQTFDMRALIQYIATRPPGSEITLGLLVGKKFEERTIALGTRPPTPGDPPIAEQRRQFVDQWFKDRAPAEAAPKAPAPAP